MVLLAELGLTFDVTAVSLATAVRSLIGAGGEASSAAVHSALPAPPPGGVLVVLVTLLFGVALLVLVTSLGADWALAGSSDAVSPPGCPSPETFSIYKITK